MRKMEIFIMVEFPKPQEMKTKSYCLNCSHLAIKIRKSTLLTDYPMHYSSVLLTASVK